MGRGEPGVGELGPGHYRGSLGAEHFARLEESGVVAATGVTVSGRPAQGVEDLPVGRPAGPPDCNPVPDHPMFTRRQAGGDGRQGRRRGTGGHGGDRASCQVGQGRSDPGPIPELEPAQPVQHEEQDPAGL